MVVDSEPVRAHQPCPDCGSSDGLTEYTDGHTYCFSCNTMTPGDGEAKAKPEPKVPGLLKFGRYADIAACALREDTCKKFGYFVKEHPKHGLLEVAPYRDETGSICSQKVRDPEKNFAWMGKPARAQLFGQHLWTPRPGSNVYLTITEGERDCLAVAQATGLKWPVVSIINGVGNAAKDIARQIEWVEQFPWVVLCFDMDGPGRAGAQEVAQMPTPGKGLLGHRPPKARP